MEGYFFYRALVTVFETDRLSTLLHYLLQTGINFDVDTAEKLLLWLSF